MKIEKGGLEAVILPRPLCRQILRLLCPVCICVLSSCSTGFYTFKKSDFEIVPTSSEWLVWKQRLDHYQSNAGWARDCVAADSSFGADMFKHRWAWYLATYSCDKDSVIVVRRVLGFYKPRDVPELVKFHIDFGGFLKLRGQDAIEYRSKRDRDELHDYFGTEEEFLDDEFWLRLLNEKTILRDSAGEAIGRGWTYLR